MEQTLEALTAAMNHKEQQIAVTTRLINTIGEEAAKKAGIMSEYEAELQAWDGMKARRNTIKAQLFNTKTR